MASSPPGGIRFSRDRSISGPVIGGFSGRGFRVDDAVFSTGLMLTPEAALNWAAPAIADLDDHAVAPLLALQPQAEFLLLGTGATLVRPSPAFVAALDARGMGCEAMDSRAAARAWGVLRAEGRWIAAALLPLDG
ncbi:MTH938/NDUFAF3 family protein [Sphingomonas sp. SCN 67-18]|uniref:MTH938/NDUFAF3 family protein n=1 Tax=uncultured Sphingomonas sp. TaxID=158754 RepID=UPI000ADFBA60|nr:MTH938/NDUFAF3 family protein [Sphingomonas sp. SCN 67-18]